MTRRGRPPVDANDPSTGVHVQLPSRVYDNLYRLAQREHTTVPAVIRELIARAPRRDDDRDDE